MVSRRLGARIRTDFGSSESEAVTERLERLDLPFLEDDHANRERVRAGVLLLARGNSSQLLRAAELAEADWRDHLVAAGLADEDWPLRLDAVLGRSAVAGA